ncbi:hypothetical protein L6164_019440 [Bauhinia variegata]|uniref:Uncharacterized protein n=1 Tax=Bauhinia variegata TaxID=167791 RepID=A0ACB9MS28_BAUVA|nr:hypothetical protein L6164_019440 [Bauhinia variegata]
MLAGRYSLSQLARVCFQGIVDIQIQDQLLESLELQLWISLPALHCISSPSLSLLRSSIARLQDLIGEKKLGLKYDASAVLEDWNLSAQRNLKEHQLD